MHRRVTLEDVAAAARVSKSSVSNVIRNHPHVRESVRKRVMDAIDELGYRPQAIGQNLVSGRTGALALAIPNFAQPYFAELARAAVDYADTAGLRLIVQQTDNLIERERDVVDAWNLGIADGLIFSPSVISDDEIERRRAVIPMVLLGERSKLTTLDRVGIDSVAIARLATEHLIHQGRTRIIMLGEKTFGDPFVVSEREEGFHAALEAAGLQEATPIGAVRDWTRSDGELVLLELIESGVEFDAVFCANDLLAVGAMSALRHAGRRVPDDVAVIGIDDIEEAHFAAPALSTVAIDRTWMAQQAIQLLQRRLEDPDAPAQQLMVPYRLVQRESTN